MPVYRVQCDACGHQDDIVRSVANYDDLPDHCEARMHRVICAPLVASDVSPYRSVVTGELIGGRMQHREHLKRHGLVEIGNEKLKPKAYEADHNVKPELMEALKQHLGR